MKALNQTTEPAKTRVAPLIPLVAAGVVEGAVAGTVGALVALGASRTLESEQIFEKPTEGVDNSGRIELLFSMF